MNWDQVQGRWTFVKGKAKEKWGKLTNDDLDLLRGQREQFLGALQARYGDEKDALHRDLDAFIQSL